MFPRLLHLLLVLTLVLNGISAPLAMAKMAHGGHPSAEAHGGHGEHSPAAVVAVESQAASSHHDHHAQGERPRSEAPATDHAEHGSCCESGACQCGCMLPPVLAVAATAMIALVTDAAALVAPPIQRVVHHDSPPLRPPLV